MNVSDFIDRLGGATKTAELYRLGQPAISTWRRNQKIPWMHYPRSVEIARERDIPLDQSWFGVADRSSNGAVADASES